MRYFLILFLAVSIGFTATGCGKNKEAEATSVIGDLDGFTKELAKKLDSGPVADAQKYLDSRKEEISSKLKSIKNIDSNDLSKPVKEKLEKIVMEDMTALQTAAQAVITKSGAEDSPDAVAAQKVMKDYGEMLMGASK